MDSVEMAKMSAVSTSPSVGEPRCASEIVQPTHSSPPEELLSLENPLELGSLLRPGNCPDGDAQKAAEMVNVNWSPCATNNGAVGKLIPQGQLGLISHRGRIEAVADGRYVTLWHRATWMKNADLRQNVIRCEALTIIRVCRGQVGKVWENGQPVLLAEGFHVYNCPGFTFDGFLDVNAPHLEHGSINIIRVKRGTYALVWEGVAGSLVPKILPEGLHVTDSPFFKFEKVVDVNTPKITHGTLALLRVEKGTIAKVVENQAPYLLGEGLHWRNSPSFEFHGFELLSSPIIQHGTITRLRVEKGKVALCWFESDPQFFEEPGSYQFDTPFFKFERFSASTERVIELGSKKIITVQSGEVGISYDHGGLSILATGRHVIDSAEHLFEAFWSTQQRSMRLAAVGQGRKQPEEVLVCETKDLVKVGIRADVFYSIEDPAKALVAVGRQETEVLVRETSIATLTNIIRSTALNEIAQSKLPSAVSEEKANKDMQSAQALGQPNAPLFFDRAHDSFLAKLHDDFLEKYGINISNIRIESFKIMDESLANSISKQAVTTAQTQSMLANLKGETEIATATQEREAAVRKIQAEAEASVLATSTDAENKSKIVKAEAAAQAKAIETERAAAADANATLAKAKADADAIRLRADAEAHAIAAKAEAEAKRAQRLTETDIGKQLALLDTYAGMVAKSNEGVSKVVYCDPALRPGNPLGLMSLDGLQAEMGTLRGIGDK